MIIQDIYQETINFAAKVHKNQKIPGTDLPYLIHLANVCMEVMLALNSNYRFNIELAVRCALLHDTIEDTPITYQLILKKFGKNVADGVLALSKNNELEKDYQVKDSIKRIKLQPKEIWIVKMADRITNLQKPPDFWTKEKRHVYLEDAKFIYNELKNANKNIATRLKQKIEEYQNYL